MPLARQLNREIKFFPIWIARLPYQLKSQEVCYPAGNNAESPILAAGFKSWVLALKRLGNIRIPIRVKLFLAITFVICLSILILSFTMLARQKDQLYSQTVEMGKVSLNYFATNANIPLLNDDISQT